METSANEIVDRAATVRSTPRLFSSSCRFFSCSLLYLVCGCVQVGQGQVEQVVLQGVDSRGDGQLQCFYGFVEDFLTEDTVESSHAVI